MRIAVAADERTGVADAVVDELRRRGHEPLLHGALRRGRPRRLGVEQRGRGRRRRRRAAPTRASSAAGRGRARRSPRTRSRASAPRSAPTRATAEGARKWNDANVLAISLRSTREARAGGDPRRVVRRGAVRRGRRPRERRAPRRDRAGRLILIDARAAARPELGGVERWARELCARLPRDATRTATRVVLPPRALSHRAGHAWEQAVLPAGRARRADALLCPANLAPLAVPRNAVVIHDAAALREPGWYSPLYARWQRRVLPRIARRARLVITVSDVLPRRAARPARRRRRGRPGRGGPRPLHARADPEPARAALGLARPYVLTVASRTSRKNLAVLDRAAPRLAGAGHRPRRRGRRPAAVQRRRDTGGGPTPRARRRRPPAGALRRARARSSCRRSTRASA